MLYTTSYNTQSGAPEDGRDHRPKHVEVIGIINKRLLLYLFGVYIIYISWYLVIQLHSECWWLFNADANEDSNRHRRFGVRHCCHSGATAPYPGNYALMGRRWIVGTPEYVTT